MEWNEGARQRYEQLNQEMVRIAQNSLIRRKLRSVSILVLLFSLTIIMSWYYGKNVANKRAREKLDAANAEIVQLKDEIQGMMDNPVLLEPVAPKIDLDLLHSEIADIGELATLEYLFTDAARFSDSKQIKNWNIPFTEKSFTLKWNGTIKVGVNLEEVTFEVHEDDPVIVVTMPPAQILSYEIDESSVEILDEKNNIFNSISVDDKIAFDESTKNAMIARAIENGILDKALINAQIMIGNIISVDPAIEGQYHIEFVISDT